MIGVIPRHLTAYDGNSLRSPRLCVLVSLFCTVTFGVVQTAGGKDKN